MHRQYMPGGNIYQLNMRKMKIEIHANDAYIHSFQYHVLIENRL